MDLTVTESQLRETPWQEVLGNAKHSLCRRYNVEFGKAWEEATESGDEEAATLYALMGGLTSLHFDLDAKDKPLVQREGFSPRWQSFAIGDVPESTWMAISEVLDEVADPEMRSRLGDVIWQEVRDYQAAQKAVPAYLNAADILLEEGCRHDVKERLRRAMQLAASLDRNGQRFADAVAFIKELLPNLGGRTELALAADLLGLLSFFSEMDPEWHAQYAKQKAEESEDGKLWIIARRFWELEAACHRESGDEEAQRGALRALAETYVKEADVALTRAGGAHNNVASMHLGKAIHAYRRVGGGQERTAELHRRLVETQKAAIGELGQTSTSIDVSDLAESAVEAVEGLPFSEAIFVLCRLADLTDVEKARQRVKDQAERYLFQSLFPAVMMSEEGKTVAKQPTAFEDEERNITSKMVMNARFHHQVVAQGCILPALGQIRLEHNPTVEDFRSLLLNSLWVPHDRLRTYARAFRAGFYGEWDICVHLLIPQIENSLRVLLYQTGEIASSFDNAGIQNEYGLNQTLYWEKTEEILKEGFLFDFRALLVDKFGPNLRNTMAHGLRPGESYFTPQVVYLWWMTLVLCCSCEIRRGWLVPSEEGS